MRQDDIEAQDIADAEVVHQSVNEGQDTGTGAYPEAVKRNGDSTTSIPLSRPSSAKVTNDSSKEPVDIDYENLTYFPGVEGQAIMISWLDSKHDEMARKIHINRPSALWNGINRMIRKQKGSGTVTANTADSLQRKQAKGESDEKVWSRIRQEWYKTQPWWHWYLSYWTIVHVEEVQINPLLEIGDMYRVEVKKLDLNGIRQGLEADVRELQRRRSTKEETVKHCNGFYDDAGRFCHVNCHNRTEECETKGLVDSEERLRKIETILGVPYWCFQDPEIANGRRSLDGIAQETSIYDEKELQEMIERSIRRKGRDGPTCRGFAIKRNWRFQKHDRDTLAAFLVTVAVVIIWRLISGNWSAASALGSVAIGFSTIFLMNGMRS